MFSSQEFNIDVATVLMDFDAQNVKYGRSDAEKYKVFFFVKTKEAAIACFQTF